MTLADSDKEDISKTFFHCNKLAEFLDKVCGERGVQRKDLKAKFYIDHGVDWEKCCLHLSSNIPEFLPGTSFDTPFPQPSTAQETGNKEKKRRRTREQGVERKDGSDLGQRSLLFLGVVRKMKETHSNFRVLLELLDLNRIQYTIAADICALLLLFGLMSASSCNPCLYCPRRRHHGTGKWEEGEVELRTLGSLREQYQGWLEAGAKTGAQHTSKWQSTVNPVLIRSLGDKDEMTVLEKAPPPAVHLLLATNDILRPHAVKFFGTEENMLDAIRTLIGAVPHSYQVLSNTSLFHSFLLLVSYRLSKSGFHEFCRIFFYCVSTLMSRKKNIQHFAPGEGGSL